MAIGVKLNLSATGAAALAMLLHSASRFAPARKSVGVGAERELRVAPKR